MDNREFLQEITQLINSSAKETREYVDASVKASAQETREYVDATAERTEAALGERQARGSEYAWNQLRALVEDALHPIRVVADGHAMLVSRMDALDTRMKRVEGHVEKLDVSMIALRDEMRAGDAALREELAAFRTEVRGEFAEVRRVARVESAVSDLSARVGRLEDRAGA
jgi:chromosome segregation ATPase